MAPGSVLSHRQVVDGGPRPGELSLLRISQTGRAGRGVSDNGRRARYYELTPRGRKHLAAEEANWEALSGVMGRILDLG